MIDLAFQPKQLDFRRLVRGEGMGAATKLAFGGARGAAKSGLVRRLMLDRRFELAGTTGFIIRRNFPDLYENHLVKFQEEYPELNQYYRATHREYKLPNGSRIAFRYADTTDQVRQIARGPEATDVMVDQAEQFTGEELVMLDTPTRRPDAPAGQCKTSYFFNPGGPGTEYLRRVFYRRQYQGEEKPQDFSFIQAYGWDNYQWFVGEVNLTQREFYDLSNDERFELFIKETSYGRKLNSLPEHLRVGELLGSFDSFSGQYFAGAWDERICVLDRSAVERIVKPWWTRWMAQDWGFGDHDCHLWGVTGKLSPSEWVQHFGGHTDSAMDICIIYREQVISDRAEADLAQDIVNLTPAWERKTIQRFFLSQDAFGQKARQFGANTIGEQFTKTMRDNGLPAPEPADQDRINGWRFVYQCLRQAHLRGANFDEERARVGPALFVSSECPQVIECMPMAVRDDKKVNDVMRVAGAVWEDVTDAVRYLLKSIQGVQWEAPVEIRRGEVFANYDAPEPEQRTTEQMTSLALAMKRFDASERSRHNRVKRRR